MNRAQARELIGTRVSAWTAMNGEYSGVLTEIIARPRAPWRGKVLIDGVIAPAHWQSGRRKQRKGFRIGQEIEVGGVNITALADFEDKPGTYLEALKRDLAWLLKQEKDHQHSKHSWWLAGTISWRREQIAEEMK